ncbi:hypothetical protein HUS23_12985 [Ectothiorhodospiraceae bacterium 2226]|nr:hypothetical protein HUS23_12985 [Ectothiorhodospiraceae bacterium 2226]
MSRDGLAAVLRRSALCVTAVAGVALGSTALAAPEDDPPPPHPAQEAHAGPGTTAETTTGHSGREPDDEDEADESDNEGDNEQAEQPAAEGG